MSEVDRFGPMPNDHPMEKRADLLLRIGGFSLVADFAFLAILATVNAATDNALDGMTFYKSWTISIVAIGQAAVWAGMYCAHRADGWCGRFQYFLWIGAVGNTFAFYLAWLAPLMFVPWIAPIVGKLAWRRKLRREAGASGFAA